MTFTIVYRRSSSDPDFFALENVIPYGSPDQQKFYDQKTDLDPDCLVFYYRTSQNDHLSISGKFLSRHVMGFSFSDFARSECNE